MRVGRGEQEEQGQTRAATEQGVHAIAPQKRTGMVSGGMADGGIGVGAAPGQDGGAVDDQIAGADEPPVQRQAHDDDEERLGHGAPARLPRASTAATDWAPAGWPCASRGSPQASARAGQPPANRAYLGRRGATACAAAPEQQATPPVAPRAPARSRWQGRRTAPVRVAHRQAAQRQQMQAGDEREGVQMQGGRLLGLGTVYAGGGTGAWESRRTGSIWADLHAGGASLGLCQPTPFFRLRNALLLSPRSGSCADLVRAGQGQMAAAFASLPLGSEPAGRAGPVWRAHTSAA